MDYDEIAACACSSGFHFQRVFSILCGYTLGEYIRSRRLTLAGSELLSSDRKVIDVALKYGYESPESFGRAFTKFHGIAPSKVKSCSQNLKSFSRLTVKLSLEGGLIMDYRIEKTEAFTVLEKKKMFNSDLEISWKELPGYWTECRKNGTLGKFPSSVSADDFPPLRSFHSKKTYHQLFLGICYPEDRENRKEFPYSIAAGYDGGPVPDGLSVSEIKAATWAVFPCKGAMPFAFQDMWKRIYSEFFPTSDYLPLDGLEMEIYPDGNMGSPDYESEIWIAVQKRK